MWNKALRMARDRPVVGWGVGTFPVRQARYYHRDVPMGPETEVLHRGGSLSDSAHNSYLQVLAEMGYPGLVLYLLVPLAFFGTALGAAPRLRPGFRQSVLLGSMAAVVGQMVSALSNPAWEYVECSMFLWLVLGLGMLAAGVGDRGRRPAPGEAAHAA